VLELFEREKIFPVGVVLNAGDAVGEGVGDGDGHGLTALLQRRRRNFCDDEGIDGGFAEDAGGVAGGVAVDFGTGRVGGGGGDVGGDEGGGVGYGHVAVDAAEDGWVACGYLVQVFTGGEFSVGPEGVVPSSALNPCAGLGGCDVGADALLHLGEGADADEVDGEFLAAGFADVGVGVVEAGHREGSVQIDDCGFGAFELQDLGVGACGYDFSVGDGEGGDLGGGCGGVAGPEVGAGEDVAVEEDGVGGLGLDGYRGGKQDGDGEGFHGWEFIRVTPPVTCFAQSLPMKGVRCGPSW